MSFLDFKRTPVIKGGGMAIPLVERLNAARRVPQAVVKVISFGHGAAAVARTMNYIGRDGELPLETETGEEIQDREELKDLAQTWSRDFESRQKSRDTVHMVFSMPKGSNPEALRKAVRNVVTIYFQDHEAVFGVHTDKDHPHAHVLLKMRGKEQGKKLTLRKAELYQLREVFAEAAREAGVPLAVSPRAVRGIGRKAEKRGTYYLRKRGRIPEYQRKTAQELIQSTGEQLRSDKPWEATMRERNRKERQAFLDAARSVQAAAISHPERRQNLLQAADDLQRYAYEMPIPRTLRQQIVDKLRGIPSELKRERELFRRGMGMER